jgi:hypothetical protein
MSRLLEYRPAVRRVASTAVIAALGAVTVPCHASGLLSVRLDGCTTLAEPEVRRVIAGELEVDLVPESAEGITALTIGCSGARVKMTVIDGITRKSVVRSFDLDASQQPAWSRLVAIAAAELVAASWSELEMVEEPSLEPVGPPPEPGAAERARQAARGYGDARSTPHTPAAQAAHWRIAGLGSARGFFGDAGVLWGGSVRVGYDHDNAAWALDAAYERGEVEPSLGRYHLSTASVGGSVAAVLPLGNTRLRVGVGVRAGYVSSRGLSADQPQGATALALWGWPLLMAGATVKLGHGMVLEAVAETSYAVLPVQPATGELAVREPWFSLQLGLGWETP